LSPESHAKPAERLATLISPLIEPLGFEVVHVEVHTHREKTLRLFIDRLKGDDAVGIEDCAAVSHAINEPLDAIPEVESVFHGPYELEVSSPGVDRPLRHARDFERFSGREARLYVFRPLTAEELGNAEFHKKHPKQKSFLGVLKGIERSADGKEQKLLLNLVPDHGSEASLKAVKGKKGVKTSVKNSAAEAIAIPLPLITKANLEPKFDFDRPAESEG